jgi:hypothetical protein
MFFKLGAKSRKKHRPASQGRRLLGFLKILAVVCVLAAVGTGFVFLEKYVASETKTTGTVELVDVPDWVNEQLKEKIHFAAGSYGKDIRLDKDAAATIQRSIESSVPWLATVKVQTTHDSVRILGRWRRPLALIELGSQKACYVDAELVVLDYVPLAGLPIVKVEGLSLPVSPPSAGKIWQLDDLAAAAEILSRLDRMDKLVTADKPLLYEIDRIDISNFNGRQSSRKPHIVLYTKDDTEIIWGAKIGSWQRYLEAADLEKLTNLYNYYKEHGTLLNSAKYIDLRSQQHDVSLPIDKY